MDTPIWMWGVFFAVVVVLLVFDLGILHRKEKEIGVRESLLMSGFYVSMGIAFGGWVWWQLGAASAQEYITGFLIEKSLSLDNIFVISLVFTYFQIPRKYQHRVLFWGILGAVLMRGVMIGLGAALVKEYHWVLYIFAAFLIYTGVKMLLAAEDDAPDIKNNKILKGLNKILRVTPELKGQKFFVKETDERKVTRTVWVATPLFLALVLIECVDIIFAVDSVPAIFAITLDPFIIYTSNIFAILGLRALYFALAAILHRFAYLKYAISLVLVFIGSKIFIVELMDWQKFPASISLGVTIALLAGGVIVSLLKTKGETA